MAGFDQLRRAIKSRLRDLGVATSVTSFAQEGEDLVLKRLFVGRPAGYFVDIGAHHPKRFSNTWLLYRSGWRGINVDAMPGSMAVFKRLRPYDINIEAALSDRDGVLEFYSFEDPALNTCSRGLAEQYQASGFRLLGSEKVRTQPLGALLDRYLPEGQPIDLLSIDVEGEDLNVLRSNDWQRYRPELLLVEVLELDSLAAVAESKEARFLAEKGYVAIAKTVNTVFFRDMECAAR